MKTEQEIKGVYQKCVDSDGYISPSILDALQWVLDIDESKELERELKDLDNCACGHWRVNHKHDGENHTGACNESHLEQGVRIYCPCVEFNKKEKLVH